MHIYCKILILFVLPSILLACSNNTVTEVKTKSTKSQKSLIEVNKYLVRVENEEINKFVKRHNWEILKTGSGLRYQVFEHGVGSPAVVGQTVTMEYEVRLISGDLVYSSDKDGLKSFIVGYGGVESGLEEAVLLLKKGDKAHIILPSHLAYGLLGDQKRIPSRSTLIYEVNILDIRN